MTTQNRHGRAIWFAKSRDGGGVYVPVTAEGLWLFLCAALWILACGVFFSSVAVSTADWRWLVGMFLFAGAGLSLAAVLIVRHT